LRPSSDEARGPDGARRASREMRAMSDLAPWAARFGLPILAVGMALCAPLASAQSREEVVSKLQPYRGDWAKGVDLTTMKGKVLCGYQGWFTTPRDGSDKGWSHYGRRGKFEPGSCTIDLWPDVSELTAEEKFLTPFRLADGSPAY